MLGTWTITTGAVSRRLPPGDDARIAIQLDPGGWYDVQPWPVGFGVPLREGQVRDPARLALATSGGTALPAAFEPRTRWPDGSVQWLWVDFLSPRANGYVLKLQAAAQPAAGAVRVSETGSAVSVDNGALRITWQRSHASPTEIQLVDETGQIAATAGGDGAGVYLIDHLNRPAVLGGPLAELSWQVETANPVRAVIRVEGWYISPTGVRMARGILRYHVWWDRPWIKIDHSFVVTRDNSEIAYKEIAVRMPAPAGEPTARFGRDGAEAFVLALRDGPSEGFIQQRTYPIYDRETSEYVIGTNQKLLHSGAEAAGWVDVNTGDAGAVMAVRDFAPQFPKELRVQRGALTAKLWSSGGGKLLDYKPATLARDFWGDNWVNNIEMSPSSAGTRAELLAYNPSNVGVARTHEIFVGYYPGAYDARRTYGWTRTFQTPPIPYPDPRWTTKVDPRVAWPMAAKGEGGARFADLERFAEVWFAEHMLPLDLFRYTGWFEWGKLPDIRYEKGANGKIYAQWTRLNNTNSYFIVKHLLQGWMRSGDRAYLDAASRYNTMLADTQVVHWGGGREQKKMGHLAYNGRQNLPIYWDGSGIFFGLSSREPIFGFALEYLLRDNRWLADNVRLVQAAVLQALRSQRSALPPLATRVQQQGAVYNLFRCDPFLALSMLMSMHRVTQDAELLDHARFLHGAITDRSALGGIDAAYFVSRRCADGPLYKPDRTAVALIEYYDLTLDANARDIAIMLSREAIKERDQPVGYQNLTAAFAGRVYEWTRDPSFLEAVRYQVEGAQRIFARYEELRADQRGLAHFTATVGPIGQGGLEHSRYLFRNVPGIVGDALLDFSSPQNGVPYLALPGGARTLDGASTMRP